jgi:hypothetical protein
MMSSEITMAVLTHPLQVLLAAMLVTRLVRMALSAHGEGRDGRASCSLGNSGAPEVA